MQCSVEIPRLKEKQGTVAWGKDTGNMAILLLVPELALSKAQHCTVLSETFSEREKCTWERWAIFIRRKSTALAKLMQHLKVPHVTSDPTMDLHSCIVLSLRLY